MSTARARGAAVAALVAATAVLAAGCGSDPDGGGTAAPHETHTRTGTARPSASASSSPAPSVSPSEHARHESGKEAPKKHGEPAADDVPKVPEAELTPATGSFTKKQKEYLADRVPKGTDPAAVLQAGQEACSRIKSTAELDRKAAVSALKNGEIPNAVPAVQHLCPTLRPLLRDAGLTH